MAFEREVFYVVEYKSATGRWEMLSVHYNKADAQRRAQDRRDHNKKTGYTGEQIRVRQVSRKNAEANRKLQYQSERYG